MLVNGAGSGPVYPRHGGAPGISWGNVRKRWVASVMPCHVVLFRSANEIGVSPLNGGPMKLACPPWVLFHSPHPQDRYRGVPKFYPIAQCVVHALKGLACRMRVTPASSPASHCKQCSALTSHALHARGCTSPSRPLTLQKT